MNLQNYYYYFQNALTPRFCDELIKYGISQQEQLALTGGQTDKVNKGKPVDDKDIVLQLLVLPVVRSVHVTPKFEEVHILPLPTTTL